MGGTPAWTQLATSAPGNYPSDASGGNSGYDASTNTLIRSLRNSTTGTIDTWILSNANGRGGAQLWSELVVGAGPNVTSWVGPYEGGLFDPGTNAFVMFGGNSNSATGELWRLSGANGTGTPVWTEASPGGALPAGRAFAGVGYSTATDQLTMYGGSKDGQNGTTELWVLTSALH